MIIDFHTHYTSGKHLFGKPYNVAEVSADMDANGIVMNLLLPTDGLVSDCKPDNDAIMEIVSQHPDRFVGTGTVNPRFTDDAVQEMKRCLSGSNMIGMKFHPWLQAFNPMESCFMTLAEEASLLKTMFYVHDGTPPYSEPLQIAEIARAFPDLTVVLGHTGLNDLWRESLLAARKYDNIWLCFCCCPFWGMKEVVNRMGGERIVWGSDYPMMSVRDTRELIRQVEHLPVADEQKEKILYGNARKLMDALLRR